MVPHGIPWGDIGARGDRGRVLGAHEGEAHEPPTAHEGEAHEGGPMRGRVLGAHEKLFQRAKKDQKCDHEGEAHEGGPMRGRVLGAHEKLFQRAKNDQNVSKNFIGVPCFSIKPCGAPWDSMGRHRSPWRQGAGFGRP